MDGVVKNIEIVGAQRRYAPTPLHATRRINRNRNEIVRSVWQRNYYEHIVRNEDELNRIREYIAYNPLRWHLDRENPERVGDDKFDLWLDRS